MCLAMAAVVMSLGFWEPAKATTASMVTARRSSAGRCFVGEFNGAAFAKER
jgi:hypothetical protein